jgi:hypothetical protein
MSLLFGSALTSGSALDTQYFYSDDDKFEIKTSGDSRFFIDNLGNLKIGDIGYSAPNDKIVLYDETQPTIRFANAAAVSDTRMGFDTSSNFIINTLGAKDIKLSTNGDTRMVIESGGDIGIGTISPSDLLHLHGASKNIILDNSDETAAGIELRDSSATGSQYFNILYDNGAARRLYFESSSGVAMTILEGGNVGIGTDSPDSLLEVYGGDLRIHNSSSRLCFYSASTERMEIGAFSSVNNINNTNRTLKIYNNTASNALVMDTSGNVGLGTASPAYQLELSTDSAGKPSTSTWSVSSDSRLKENIITANYDLCYANVKAIDLRYFKWTDDYINQFKLKDEHRIGFIADEIQVVYPKAVNTFNLKKTKEVIVEDVEIGVSGVEIGITRVENVAEEWINDCKSLNIDLLLCGMYGALKKVMENQEDILMRLSLLEN